MRWYSDAEILAEREFQRQERILRMLKKLAQKLS
jgi:hypothetical protein